MNHTKNIARRAFLQRVGQLGIVGTAAPWALNLAAIGDAAAATNPSDYKALVCIFLNGGNDNGNTVIPYDSPSHAEYVKARGGLMRDGGLGIERGLLSPLSASIEGLAGAQYALAPQFQELRKLFESDQLAVQFNVGPLIQATTLEQYRNRSVPLPPKLFSHNDQQSIWQSSRPEGSVTGWGGQLGDLMLDGNGENRMFTCMSVTGNTVFLSGNRALSYQIGTGGAVRIRPALNRNDMFGSDACAAALKTLITQERSHLLEKALNQVTLRSINSEEALTNALALTDKRFDGLLPDTITEKGPDGNDVVRGRPLNRQLKMVARLIAAQQQLGLKRQVFMVSLGGFDTHDNLTVRHADLLRQLDQAMGGFQAILNQEGKGKAVTTFTASDFGRTITSNGDGSDHGWGSHHFVMGGAVKGRAFYGTPPSAVLGGIEDVGHGRYIPSTSVDQYAATLAQWFGVDDSAKLGLIAPHLKYFNKSKLSFLD